jgi:hypothetical protein
MTAKQAGAETCEDAAAAKTWNGKSTELLHDKMDRRNEIGRALVLVRRQLEQAADAVEQEINAEIVRLLDRPDLTDPADVARAYGWDCADSPTGLCIYNTAEDPMMDECLFCGDPKERI